jgi:precorrin-6B methylase 1
MFFNLMQMLPEKAREIGKATAIIGLQRELDGFGNLVRTSGVGVQSVQYARVTGIDQD